MRISDWSSDVCSSDLHAGAARPAALRVARSRTCARCARDLRAPGFARSTSPPADRSTLRIDRRDRSETRAAVCRRGFQRLVAARQSAPAVLRLAGSFHERARSSRSLVSGALAAAQARSHLLSECTRSDEQTYELQSLIR